MTFLGVLAGLFALGWLFYKLSESEAAVDRLARRVLALENRLSRQGITPAPVVVPGGEATEPAMPTEPLEPAASVAVPTPERAAAPPPLPAMFPHPPPVYTSVAAAATPPPATPVTPASIRGPLPAIRPSARPTAINWESFLGVKLFAWLGGFALFLGVAFFVKYSFEHNLISPFLRVMIGYGIGLGLVAGAWWMPRARHVVTVQSLTATGIVVLYADTFAAQAHYGFLGLFSAFAIMSAITVLAFVLAVRLEAQVVAVLGWLGGFLTPGCC